MEHFKGRLDRLRYRRIDLQGSNHEQQQHHSANYILPGKETDIVLFFKNNIIGFISLKLLSLSILHAIGKEEHGSNSEQCTMNKITEKYEREQTSEESEYLAKRNFNVNEVGCCCCS